MKYLNKQLQDKVEVILSTYPQSRDNDNLLISTVWYSEIEDKNIRTAIFLRKIANGELTSTESICRVRRKVQEQNPHLRGERWKLRHEKADEVRREVSESRGYTRGEGPREKSDISCNSQVEFL